MLGALSTGRPTSLRVRDAVIEVQLIFSLQKTDDRLRF